MSRRLVLILLAGFLVTAIALGAIFGRKATPDDVAKMEQRKLAKQAELQRMDREKQRKLAKLAAASKSTATKGSKGTPTEASPPIILNISPQASSFVSLQPASLLEAAEKNLSILRLATSGQKGAAKTMNRVEAFINSPEVQKIHSIQYSMDEDGKLLYGAIEGAFNAAVLAEELAAFNEDARRIPGSNPPRWRSDKGELAVLDDGRIVLGPREHLRLAAETRGNKATGFLATALSQVDPNAELIVIAPFGMDVPGGATHIAVSADLSGGVALKTFVNASAQLQPMVQQQIDQGKMAWPLLRSQINPQDLLAGRGAGAREVALVSALGDDMANNMLTLVDDMVATIAVRPVDGGLLLTAESDVGEDGAAAAAVYGVLAVVAIPAFIKYMRRAKTTEAIDQLDKIYKGAAVYYTNQRISREGDKLPCQFPAPTGMIPPVGPNGEHPCCSSKYDSDGDGRCDSMPELWDDSTWSALSFQMNDQHYFAYEFDSRGELSDAYMTATAYGDLDCDGVWSTFQRLAFGDPQATRSECSIRGAAAFYVENETE